VTSGFDTMSCVELGMSQPRQKKASVPSCFDYIMEGCNDYVAAHAKYLPTGLTIMRRMLGTTSPDTHVHITTTSTPHQT
jgi:hypothetical protein